MKYHIGRQGGYSLVPGPEKSKPNVQAPVHKNDLHCGSFCQGSLGGKKKGQYHPLSVNHYLWNIDKIRRVFAGIAIGGNVGCGYADNLVRSGVCRQHLSWGWTSDSVYP
jgi:hypothetical protein